jgi:hypothetical protein
MLEIFRVNQRNIQLGFTGKSSLSGYQSSAFSAYTVKLRDHIQSQISARLRIGYSQQHDFHYELCASLLHCGPSWALNFNVSNNKI